MAIIWFTNSHSYWYDTKRKQNRNTSLAHSIQGRKLSYHGYSVHWWSLRCSRSSISISTDSPYGTSY